MLLFVPAPAGAITCTGSASSLPFGQYNGVTKAQVNTTASISVSCTGPGTLNYTVTISPGQSGVATGRYMLSNANALNYQIYKDSARTQVLGDGTGGTYEYSGSYTLGNGTSTLSATVYGAVLPNQAAIPGSYSDSLTMTLTY